MRRADRIAVPLVSVALAAAGLACATTSRVGMQDDVDFSQLRTWDWHGRVSHLVDGQHGGGPDLDGLLAHLIRGSLEARGYPRNRRSPDFFVTYDFSLQRHARVVHVPKAPYLLSSMHSSPSYWIEGSEKSIEYYRVLRIAVAIAEPGGRIVWKGALRKQLDDFQRPPLKASVAGVLEHFPKAPDGPRERWVRVAN